MGIGRDFAEAFAKALAGGGMDLPNTGRAFISLREADKHGAVDLAQQLIARGFELVATGGTEKVLTDAGIACTRVNKVKEGRPHCVDMIKNNEINLIFNTTEGKRAIEASKSIRSAAIARKVAYFTTLAGARAACMAMGKMDDIMVYRLQDLHKELCLAQ